MVGLLILLLLLVTPAQPAYAREEISLTLIPLYSPTDMYKRFLPLKRYLEDNLNISIKMRVAKNTDDIVRVLRDGETDIAFICPTLYAVAGRDTELEPLVKLRINGKSDYRSAIVVRDDSPFRKTADLMDGMFVYGRYNCPGSGLLPSIMLKRAGISADSLFEVVRLGSDESALIAVMARMFDATGVPEMLIGPYMESGLRVLRYSYPIPQYLFVARRSLDKDFIRRLRQAMLSLNNIKRGGDIMGSMEKGVDGLSEAVDHEYDIVRVLMESISREKYPCPEREGNIRIVVEPVFFEPYLFERLNPLVLYLSERTGLRFQLMIPEDTKTFLSMKERGEGEVFIFNGELYHALGGNAGMSFVSDLPDPVFSNERRGIIITQTGSGIRRLEDLPGKTVGIPSFYSDGGYVSTVRLLKEGGVSSGSVRFIELKTYEDVIMAVYYGRVDAGFVSMTSLSSMEEDIHTGRIMTVGMTPELRRWVIAARDGLESRVVEGVRNAVTEFFERYHVQSEKNL